MLGFFSRLVARHPPPVTFQRYFHLFGSVSSDASPVVNSSEIFRHSVPTRRISVISSHVPFGKNRTCASSACLYSLKFTSSISMTTSSSNFADAAQPPQPPVVPPAASQLRCCGWNTRSVVVWLRIARDRAVLQASIMSPTDLRKPSLCKNL